MHGNVIALEGCTEAGSQLWSIPTSCPLYAANLAFHASLNSLKSSFIALGLAWEGGQISLPGFLTGSAEMQKSSRREERPL